MDCRTSMSTIGSSASFVYNLPFGDGEDRWRCDRREERGDRRLAGERHLHLAARVPAHDHGRRCRRPQRHVRHQPRQSGRGSEQRRRDGEPVVQHGGFRPAGAPALLGDLGTKHQRGPG